MAVQLLQILPDSTGYALTDGNEVVVTDLPGGLPRRRRDFIGACNTVTLQWTLGPVGYRYMRAFYRTATSKAAAPFQLQLIIDDAPKAWYTCTFVPGTFGLTSTEGLSFVIGATINVADVPADAAADQGIIDGFIPGTEEDDNCNCTTTGDGMPVGLVIVPYSSDMIVDLSKGSEYKLTLAGNPNSFGISNAALSPAIIAIRIVQDGGGNHIFPWPTAFRGHDDINPAANSTSTQVFARDSDGNFDAIAPMRFS